MKAVWFSRHEPTPEQLSGADGLGFEIVAIEEGRSLGAMALDDDASTLSVLTSLLMLVDRHGANAIFGVASTRTLEMIHATAEDAVLLGDWRASDTPFWSARNIQRAAEGGKPTFQHAGWRVIGRLSRASLRWLM